ncbi:MAG TPA: TonB-dependent receptor, partial [Opitutaceae bacterium]|nr:TonB-dependent receptor [Opitutaceae bacterium]
YLVLAYQKALAAFDFQVAAFTRYGRIHFQPDYVGDLVFNGVASNVIEDSLSNGVQFDAVHPWNNTHKVRAGLLLTQESAGRDTATAVFGVASDGALLSGEPISIADKSRLRGLLTGVYLQDEWHLAKTVTVNYGTRAEFFDAFIHESQLDPRVNVVWTPDSATSVHLGYARYFTPPTLQYISAARIAKFAGTTNAPETFEASPPRSERAHDFDVGASRKLTPDWQVTFDAFFKVSRNTQDLGQFGNAIILAPFNYRKGGQRGCELSTTYHQGGFSTYANVSFVRTRARQIVSAQFEFPENEISYIADHDIRMDHEGEFTVSSGVAYRLGATKVFGDFLYGSGLHNGFANTTHLPEYHPVNLGVERSFSFPSRAFPAVTVRIDVLNIFDETYRLRDGTGIGIAASQYGMRRGLFAGVSTTF